MPHRVRHDRHREVPVARSAIVLLTVFLVATRASGACDPTTEPDRSDVAAARAAVASGCDCATAARHGTYVSCAASVARATLQNPSCAGFVQRCAARSTCGRAGAVTCCRTNLHGVTRCSIKRDAAHCRPPREGLACTGLLESCCDACTASGCATTSTTTTSTTVTTTSSTTTTTGSGTTTTTLCGGFNGPCCAGDTCTESSAICISGTCYLCGFLGSPCCAGGICHSFPLTQCINGGCQ
jgi:hypothetical protein